MISNLIGVKKWNAASRPLTTSIKYSSVSAVEQLIMNGCQNATSKELLNIVCELREYTSYHFYTEEDLMAKYNYPMSDKHKASHVEFRSNILNINLPLLGKHPEQVLPQIKIHLQDFLFNHILIEDQELGRYIKTCANE